MKEVRFNLDSSLISSKVRSRYYSRLFSHLNYIEQIQSLNLCQDKKLHEEIHSLTGRIKKHNPEYLVVVGIGGSNLGTQAVQQLVQGKLYNERTNRTKVLYADTVDTDEINEIKEIISKAIKNGKKVILNCVTKSGTTTETIANFEIILETIKKQKDYKDQVVITTDKNSPLYYYALKEGFHILTIPKEVGGRYSVLSAVSLFPLEIAGIDIDLLLKGASSMRSRCIEKSDKNPAISSSIVRYLHASNNKTIQDLFLFGNDFKSLGKWYRQLFAESLGKGCDIHNKKCIGITPTYSIGSTDMHSIAQLYLGGPYDKLTTFVKIEKSRTNLKLPKHSEFNNLVNNIQGKSLEKIMDAIYQGVKRAFIKDKRPFTELVLPDKSEYSIGQFLQMQMTEVIFLAKLLNVNPFDQPDIENYKSETRRLLAN